MTSHPIVLAAACLLTACAPSTICVNPVPLPPIPANLMAECPPLMELRSPLLPALAASLARDSLMYNDCATRHKLLSDLIRNREKKEEK